MFYVFISVLFNFYQQTKGTKPWLALYHMVFTLAEHYKGINNIPQLSPHEFNDVSVDKINGCFKELCLMDALI